MLSQILEITTLIIVTGILLNCIENRVRNREK
jgi:hypothetical protein